MNPITLYINGQSLIVPGYEDHNSVAETLELGAALETPEDWKPCPPLLTKRAAKRLSDQTLLAIAAADPLRAVLNEESTWVFGSAYGEGETLKVILDSLRRPDMAVRPLRFQNSVHNAASGQWTIAAKSQSAATSICAGAATAGAGLLKAAMQSNLEDRSVGLVLFDAPLPPPLDKTHKVAIPGAVGLALSPVAGPSPIARLDLMVKSGDNTSAQSTLGRQTRQAANPSLAILPLIERVVGQAAGPMTLSLNGGTALSIEVTPC